MSEWTRVKSALETLKRAVNAVRDFLYLNIILVVCSGQNHVQNLSLRVQIALWLCSCSDAEDVFVQHVRTNCEGGPATFQNGLW